MTQGKIERWHQTLKNRIPLEDLLPGDLEAQIEAFIADYNHLRYHESIGNLAPADVHFGRDQTILIERERIKRQTIANRRLLHRRKAAKHHKPDEPEPLLSKEWTVPLRPSGHLHSSPMCKPFSANAFPVCVFKQKIDLPSSEEHVASKAALDAERELNDQRFRASFIEERTPDGRLVNPFVQEPKRQFVERKLKLKDE